MLRRQREVPGEFQNNDVLKDDDGCLIFILHRCYIVNSLCCVYFLDRAASEAPASILLLQTPTTEVTGV